jgi:hypothetical protein
MTALQHAREMLAAYIEAEKAILLGKETRLSSAGLDRSLKMEDLNRVQAGRAEWEKKVARLEAGSVPTFGGARFRLADVSNPGGW